MGLVFLVIKCWRVDEIMDRFLFVFDVRIVFEDMEVFLVRGLGRGLFIGFLLVLVFYLWDFCCLGYINN